MSSTCVRMTVEWVTPIGQTRAMTMALHSVADETRTAHGCVGCSVSIDIDTRGLVRYTEEWLTEDDLRQRLLADSFSRLFTLIKDATRLPGSSSRSRIRRGARLRRGGPGVDPMTVARRATTVGVRP
jgi:quinol monooxygenase YgiN